MRIEKRRKHPRIYHDYVNDFWQRGPYPCRADRDSFPVLAVAFLALLLVVMFVRSAVPAETYTVTREESNLYRVNVGCTGCWFVTKYCYEDAWYEDVVYDGCELHFPGGESCEAKLVR